MQLRGGEGFDTVDSQAMPLRMETPALDTGICPSKEPQHSKYVVRKINHSLHVMSLRECQFILV